MIRRSVLMLAFGVVPAVGCASSGRTIKIPESAVVRPSKAGAKKRAAGAEPFVIKMSDGERVWQFDIPAPHASAAFEAVIPLNLGDELSAAPLGSGAETPADRDVKAAAGKRAPDGSGGAPGAPSPPGPSGGTLTGPGDEASPSYLATLAKVNALFRKRQYELALIELTRLEQAYPEDERVLEMKGTLYWRLRKPKLAREAWERALAINPDNAAVAQALENLLAE